MSVKQTLAGLMCVISFGWAGKSPAEPQDSHAYEHSLSSSEHKRMRGDLERFSREQPRRGDFEKRRQIFRERARQRFQEADTDGNGLLNREELTRLSPNAAKNFDQIDRNVDGELSEQEVAQILRQRRRQHNQRASQHNSQQKLHR